MAVRIDKNTYLQRSRLYLRRQIIPTTIITPPTRIPPKINPNGQKPNRSLIIKIQHIRIFFKIQN